jgi:hypothetical protein
LASETEHKSSGGTISVGGKKVKKSTAGLVGIAAVGVVAVAVMRKKSAAAAAAATPATATTFTDPAGNSCAAPNPATGYCPGSPEDISATEQLSAGSTDYGLSNGGSGVYTSPSLYGNSTGTTSAVPVFTDNGSWAQYVEQALGSDGTDAIAAAIAKYLSGQSVTSAQQTTIEQAIAIANYPPVSGSGGFPPSLNLQASTPVPTPVPTPTPTPPVTVPPTTPPVPVPPVKPTEVSVTNVVGKGSEAGTDILLAQGLKVDNKNPTPKGKAGVITSQSPKGGARAAKGSTVTIHAKIN